MKARVEELVLRYRLPRDAPRLHAQLPSIERALHSRLADEIASQLEAIDEGSEEVIVVREATAHVTLRIGEHARDAAALERVAQAARETVVALLARPADDDEQVRRFPSDAAYAGSFIVELLGGTAWDRWYFDSFSRFRRADARTTVVALLAGADTECMALFAWLEQRGRLADVLRLVGPSAARALASASPAIAPASVPPADLAPLAVAAFAIAASLGVSVDASRREELLAEYHRHDYSRPAWTDRRALTEWTWRFTRWIMSRDSSDAAVATISATPPAALVSLLAEQLDWLEGDTILARVAALSAQPPEPRVMSARAGAEYQAAPRHAAQLRIIAESIRRGSLRIDLHSEPRDQLVLRLLASLHSADPAAPARPDMALVAILDDVVAGALQLVAASADPHARLTAEGTPRSRRVTSSTESHAPDAIAGGRDHGADAVALVRALVAREPVADGLRSSHAGIFLLTRPIADLRLDRLAERAGVSWPSLLAALAMKLLGATLPFDHAIHTWLGAPDVQLADLDEGALHALQQLVFGTLADQRQLPADAAAVASFAWRDEAFVAVADESGTCWPLVAPARDDALADLVEAWRAAMGGELQIVESARAPTADLEALPATPELSPTLDAYVASLASCVMRALSRWLPGLGGSSVPFLVRNCIARGGTISVSEEQISIVLDRGPLDVVLEMAGCFAPMTSATWLGRGVRFSFASA